MTYPEAIKYLESFINYEKISSWPYKGSLKLERIRCFLGKIDNPQDSLNCIHIAGSKGKGSTSVFISYILKQAGYRVGLYTSPHLSDFRERIRILSHHATTPPRHQNKEDFEGMISEKELVEVTRQLKPTIEEYNQNSQFGPLSFFEVYTALAFLYFKQQKVDFAVLETGLGGRLDATNVVNPLVCAITPISFEHTQKLGNTLKEIAAEKAGIIKSHNVTKSPSHQLVVITAPQEEEAMEVIRDRCKTVEAKLYEVNKDIFYEMTRQGFNIMGMFGEYPHLEIRLIGKHQVINAAVAIGAIEALQYHNIFVDIDSMRWGLYNATWPGRCEVISKNPLVVLDGAQNVASADALKEAIKGNFKFKRLILTLGISSDKDIKGICNQLYGLADEVILTKANNPRATAPQDLAKYFDGKTVHITNDVREARKASQHIAGKDDLILVTGSLFVVGEFRNEHS